MPMSKRRNIRSLAGEIISALDHAARDPEHPFHPKLHTLQWDTRCAVGDLVMAVLARHDRITLMNDPDLPVEPLPPGPKYVIDPELAAVLATVGTAHFLEWLDRLDSDPRLEGLNQQPRGEEWWVFALCRSAEAADSLTASLRAEGWSDVERFNDRCVWLQPSGER
jgi:hypothetical protein